MVDKWLVLPLRSLPPKAEIQWLKKKCCYSATIVERLCTLKPDTAADFEKMLASTILSEARYMISCERDIQRVL